MPPLNWVTFITVSSLFFLRDTFAHEDGFPSKTWHSYVFNSGAGNREGLNISKLEFSDIGSAKNIRKWQTLEEQFGFSVFGLGSNFIQVTFFHKGEKPYSAVEVIDGFLSDIAVFQKWSPRSQRTENFAVVASCDGDVICFLHWYQIHHGNLTHIWSWQFTRNITNIKVLSFNYELQLLIISHSHAPENNTFAEIYSFSVDQVLDLWLADKFSLVEKPSTTSVSHCDDIHNTFLSFAFPKMEMIFVYKYHKFGGHSHFILHKKIHSKSVISLTGFCFHFQSYLAVASSNSTIYKFNGDSEWIPITRNFGTRKNWFIIPVNTYHKDMVLIAEGKNESLIFYLTGDRHLQPANNLSNTICNSDFNCSREVKELSLEGAATFFYNDNHHIAYTTKKGNPKLLTFSVEIKPLIDKVELQLREVYSYKSLLEEKIKEQELKRKKLDEAIFKISNEFTDTSQIYWTLKNVKASSVSVKEKPNATIDNFEYAFNKDWVDSDYSIYLDLLTESRSEDLLGDKISEIKKLFQDFERSSPIESAKFTGLLNDDVLFLGSVTVGQLELSHLNGIDVNDMLQNSLMLGHRRKIGGIKTAVHIEASHIIFQKLGDIPAYDIMFSDELIENKNVINGVLVYENDVKILEVLELFPDAGRSEYFGLYPFHHVLSFTDEIVFDHLSITEDSVVEETMNGQPLILPVRSSPFDMFSLENVNQARIEMIKVENHAFIGFINGEDVTQTIKSENYSINKNEFSTTNLLIEYLNNKKFPEEFVRVNGEKSININNKNFTGTLIVKNLYFQDKRSEDYLKNLPNLVGIRTFQNIEIRETLTTKMINNCSWEQLEDIVKKENRDRVQRITGAKYIKRCKLLKNLNVSSGNMDNIMNNYSEQELSNLTFTDVVIHNLNITGEFDGLGMENVKESTVRLSDNNTHESTLIFQDGSEPYFNSLAIFSSINNVTKFTTKNTEELIVHKDLTFDVLNVTNLVVNGTLTYYDQEDIVSAKKSTDRSIYQYYPYISERRPSHKHETSSKGETVDVETVDSASKKISEHSVYELLRSGSGVIKSVLVEGNIKTREGINGYSLMDFDRNAVHVNRTGHINKKLVFDDLVEFKNLRINGTLQGLQLKRLNQDLVFDSSYVFLKATKNFLGNLTVTNKMKARTLNGRLLQRILTKEGDHSLKGSIAINGDVRINGNIASYGTMNGYPIADILKKYSFSHDSFVIREDIQLQVSEIDYLIVEGSIQNNSFGSLMDDLVTISGDSYITARKVILGPVNFEESITVEETLNGLNISQFNNDIVLINKDVNIRGDLIVGKTIMRSLEVKNDINSTLIHGFDTSEWLEEGILLDQSVSISGYKKFKNVNSYEDIAADYVNNYLTINAIPLNKEQFIPCSGQFLKLTSFSDVSVGHSVNGKILRTEYADTVLVDEEQEIKASLTFVNDFTVENNVIIEDVEFKDLLNVTTLYTDQIISSVVYFEDEVITNGDIDNLEHINGVDIRKWNEESVSLNENQVINGSWVIKGNITVNKNVEGKGLLGGQSVANVGKSIVKAKMLAQDVESKRNSDFRNQCEKISNFSKKISLQPKMFHHFEVSQMLKSSANIESVITFKANDNHYLMLTFSKECLSVLYQWNETISKFNSVNRMNIGPVTKWITLYHKNMMYLVTSSSHDVICEENSKRGNIWAFDGDRYKYGHLYTTEEFKDIIKSKYSAEKYYTFHKNGDLMEWTIEPEISAKILVNFGNDNYEFLDYDVIGELALSNGREIKNKENTLIHKFSKPYYGRIAVTVIKGKKLTVVPYRDELVIYENILEQKVYAAIPASKVRSMLWLSAGSRYPYLLYDTEQKSIEIIHFRGAKRFFDKITIPMPSENLLLTSIPRGENLVPKEFVIVVQKKKILLLETFYLGNMYIETENRCE